VITTWFAVATFFFSHAFTIQHIAYTSVTGVNPQSYLNGLRGRQQVWVLFALHATKTWWLNLLFLAIDLAPTTI